VPKERAARGRAAARGGAGELAVGLRVRIESLGRTGTVIELRDGKAMVEAGSLRMLLPREDLTVLPAGDQEPAPQQPKRRTVAAGGGYMAAAEEASIEVDLRGMRPDEVEFALGRALDSAILAGLPSFRIIHGKGTGALRARVQELLRADRRVTTFRPGERYEGGTGVTVAEF
jgi:DNA mismatch repair protein MutS2